MASWIVFQDMTVAFYAGVAVVVTSLVMDYVLYGPDEAKLIYIISDNPEKIKEKITSELELTATIIKAKGAYTKTDKEILMIVIRKQISPKVEEIVKIEDPKAFMIVSSASEIFAGAIQDQDRGTIIGRTSYGKGLIQRIIKYKDGSGIRITTAKYMTPSGRPIQRPYTLGNGDAYYSDSTRFLHPDSIHHADSLKFRTLKRGREVYAGGGITPDIYIEKRSANLSDCVKKSLLDAIIEHSEIEFWNTSSISDMLTRYPTIECFANEYVVSTELWDILFGLGGYSAEDITDTDREYLETMLCAAIAERLYGIEARYYINICRSDYMAQQAISIATSSREF